MCDVGDCAGERKVQVKNLSAVDGGKCCAGFVERVNSRLPRKEEVTSRNKILVQILFLFIASDWQFNHKKCTLKTVMYINSN